MKITARVLSALILMMVLLSACDTGGEVGTTPTQVQNVETFPSTPTTSLSPVQGTLQTSLLEVPGEPERCSTTSVGICWETENGFYLTQKQLLYYADKTDMTSWYPVCSKADCSHKTVGIGLSCDARTDWVYLKGDRIYRAWEPDYHFTLLSSALDGTDWRTEYVFEDALEGIKKSGSGNISITSEYLVGYTTTLNSKGTYDFRLFTLDEDGLILHIEEERDVIGYGIGFCDSSDRSWFRAPCVTGDYYNNTMFTVEDGQLVSVDLTGLPVYGSYFTGDTLLAFRPNDGYYRIDTETREEVKLAEPQLADSNADIALPNCILESTLMWERPEPTEPRTEDHELWLFNGQQWLEVSLPEELRAPDCGTQILNVTTAVASDRLLLLAMPEGYTSRDPYQLYQILLTTDTPVLEYLTDIAPGP